MLRNYVCIMFEALLEVTLQLDYMVGGLCRSGILDGKMKVRKIRGLRRKGFAARTVRFEYCLGRRLPQKTVESLVRGDVCI